MTCEPNLFRLFALHDRRPPYLAAQSFDVRVASQALYLLVIQSGDVSLLLQVLSNGVECRLQRNALAVLEAPTGNETVSGTPRLFLIL